MAIQINLSNTVTNLTRADWSTGTDFTDSSCQYSWDAPAWESWPPLNNLVKEDWNAFILGLTIATPPQPGQPPYDGTHGSYAVDPWNYDRNSIGGFWSAPEVTNSTYFVNLSQRTNGEGTVENPLGSSQFFILASNRDTTATFYIKGQYSQNDRIGISNDSESRIKMLAWDSLSFGPWLLQVTGWTSELNLSGVEEIQGGLVTSEVIVIVNNCQVKTSVFESKETIQGIDSTFLGCTFTTPRGLGDATGYFRNVSFKDCIFPNVTWNEDLCIGMHFEGCAANNNPQGRDDKHNSQFNWKSPKFPGTSLVKEDWDKNKLLLGIRPPVLKGTPPYPGYNTDLWGFNRFFIGAVACLGPVPIPRTEATSDTGSGSRSVSNGTMADYHSPWWLDVRR